MNDASANAIRSAEDAPPRLGVTLDSQLQVLDVVTAGSGVMIDPRPWIAHPAAELFAPDDRDRVNQALERAQDEGSAELLARLALDRHASPCLVRVRAGTRFMHMTIEPPSARAKTFPERENRLEQLGLVASRVSHDLKNLLAAVLINAELIPRTTFNPESTREISKEIVLATERARELLEQILGYASAADQPRRTLDLNALTREMGRLLEVSAPTTVVLRYHLEAELPLVSAHAPLLRQLLMNFIVNAGDAIGEEVGAITITTTGVDATAELLENTRTSTVPSPGHFVCLQVEDTGPGLDEQTARRIFDPFFTTKDGGHGLGLSACLSIVEEHEGALLLDSEPNRGAKFRVLLPASTDARPRNEPELIEALEHDLAGHLVLIVDDDAFIRSVIRRTLGSQGMQVLTARDGLEGIDVFEKNHERLSCVMLDMGMPHIKGSDVFDDLRNIDPDVPIVFASGHGQAQLFAEDAVIRADGVLLKPFREVQLLNMLQRVIGRRPPRAHDLTSTRPE